MKVCIYKEIMDTLGHGHEGIPLGCYYCSLHVICFSLLPARVHVNALDTQGAKRETSSMESDG